MDPKTACYDWGQKQAPPAPPPHQGQGNNVLHSTSLYSLDCYPSKDKTQKVNINMSEVNVGAI